MQPHLLLALLVPLLLSILGSAAHADEAPIRLRFLFSHYYAEEQRVMDELVARFNADHPGIHVEAVTGFREGSAATVHDAYTRFLALEDPAVDVMRVDVPWIPEFADPGWLHPLDALVPDAERSFVASALEGGRYRGTLYALPLTLKGNLLFYRKDLLEGRGWKAPVTFEELAVQARLLVSSEVPVGIALHSASFFHNDFYPFVWASGGDVLEWSDDPLARPLVVLNQPRNVEVLEAILALFEPASPLPAAIPRERFLGPWSESYRAPLEDFARGEAAFLVSWSDRWDRLQMPDSAVRGKVGIAAIPGLGGKGRASNLGSWYVAISRFSPHPEAAATFVRYLTSAPVQRIRLERQRDLPSRLDVLTDAETLARDPHFEELHAIIAQARLRPRVPNEREVDGVVERQLQRAVRGELSAAHALEAAAEGIRPLLLPPPPPPAPAPLREASAAPAGAWRTPLWLATGAIAVVVLLGIGLILRHRRRPLRVMSRISTKLALFGGATIFVLMLVASALTAAHALADQERELQESRAFFAAQLEEGARSIAKQLGLAASLLADRAEATPSDRDRRAAQVIVDLLVASHFTRDILFMELVDRDGGRLASDRDILDATNIEALGHWPRADDAEVRVKRRSISVRERADGAGEPYLDVYVPVFRQGVHLGAIRIGVSEATYRRALQDTAERHEAAISRIVWLSAGVSLALLVLGILLVAWLSRRLSGPIVALTRSAEQIRAGDLEVALPAGPSDEIGTLTHAMGEMVVGLKQRDFIREAFGRYVTPDLAERVLTDPESLAMGGRTCDVTILMSDLRGFTSLTAQLGPERMVQLLNRYLSRMTTLVVEHGGSVNELIGDAILVVFGAPIEQPDHALRAVRCAVAMQRAMVPFNAESRALGFPTLEMGIGINSGLVVAGNIGGEEAVRYGVIGTTVNMAGRIEGLTIGWQVLVSATTREAAGPALTVRAPMEVTVKGGAAPLVVYEVESVDGQPVPERVIEGAEVSLALTWRRVVSKAVEPQVHEGRLVFAGPRGGVMTTTAPSGVGPRDDLVLRVLFPDGEGGDIYAKVLSVGQAEGRWRAELSFTAIGQADRAALVSAAT